MEIKSFEQQLEEFISETTYQIFQKENDINDKRVDYHKKKSLINTKSGIVLLLSMTLFIVGVYYTNWSCGIVSLLIGVLGYNHIKNIKNKTFKAIAGIIKSLYHDLHDLERKLARAKEGWLPCEDKVHGDTTYM